MENKYEAGLVGGGKKLERKENNATQHALRINTRHRKQAYQSNGETAREGRIGSFIDTFIQLLRFRPQILPDRIDIPARTRDRSDPRRPANRHQLPLSRGKKILSIHFQLFYAPIKSSSSSSPVSILRVRLLEMDHVSPHFAKNFLRRMRDRNFYSEIGSKDVKLVIEEYYFYLTSGRNIRNRYFQAPKERPFLSRVSLFLEINASINYLSRETMAAITILLFYPSTRRFHSNIFCFERQNPFREKEISLRVSIGGDVGWNNYEGLERFFETAREQRV